jgi:hypothetical protein
MTQQLFDDLTADAPPSTVDVHGIIRRERRRRTLVRAALPAVAVLAAAGTFAAFAPGAGTAPVTTATAATTAPATTSPAAAPGFRLVAADQATAASLRAALDAAVHRTAPGATWLTQGLTRDATPDGQPPRIAGDDPKAGTGQMFTGSTGLAVDGRRGTLSLSIINLASCTPSAVGKCSTPKDMAIGLYSCRPAAKDCTASTGADGRRQRVQTMESLGGFLSRETTVELADGRALLLTVDNQFIAPGATSTAGDVAQPATPLTPAQVSTIATTVGGQIIR